MSAHRSDKQKAPETRQPQTIWSDPQNTTQIMSHSLVIYKKNAKDSGAGGLAFRAELELLGPVPSSGREYMLVGTMWTRNQISWILFQGP